MTAPSENYRLIPLTQGQFAKVSPEDYDWLSQWKWHAIFEPCLKTFYAVRNSQRDAAGKQKSLKMHRVVLGLEHGDHRKADHINHDTLDNRRSNLRTATSVENGRNRRVQINSASGIIGVNWHKGDGMYHARIKVNGKTLHLGSSRQLDVAVSLRRKAEQKYFGEFVNGKARAAGE